MMGMSRPLRGGNLHKYRLDILMTPAGNKRWEGTLTMHGAHWDSLSNSRPHSTSIAHHTQHSRTLQKIHHCSGLASFGSTHPSISRHIKSNQCWRVALAGWETWSRHTEQGWRSGMNPFFLLKRIYCSWDYINRMKNVILSADSQKYNIHVSMVLGLTAMKPIGQMN
jgi:hypothetical protein